MHKSPVLAPGPRVQGLSAGPGQGRGWDGVPVTAQADAGDVVLPG